MKVTPASHQPGQWTGRIPVNTVARVSVDTVAVDNASANFDTSTTGATLSYYRSLDKADCGFTTIEQPCSKSTHCQKSADHEELLSKRFESSK
jgi:hypothetical protein